MSTYLVEIADMNNDYVIYVYLNKIKIYIPASCSAATLLTCFTAKDNLSTVKIYTHTHTQFR